MTGRLRLGALADGAGAERERAALARAAGVGVDSTWHERGLTLALGGDARPSRAGGIACVLDGHVYDVAGQPDVVPPGSGPGTETALAAAFAGQGEALLPRLRGDFAIVLWDAERGRGWLVRDQLGAAGLVWHASGGRVLFATENADLLPALPTRPEPDAAAVAHWIAISGMPEDRTFHSGVRRVKAAWLVRIGNGAPEPARYWEPAYRRPQRMERAEAAARLRDRLALSVHRRLPEGNEGGVLLSGGLDSASVAALAAEAPAGRRPAAGYSAVFPDHPSVDEAAIIEELTAKLELPSVRLAVRDGSVLDGALSYIGRWQLPPSSPNLFFWLPLFRRAAADGTRVLLDGEGGDELFGLSPYLMADRLRRGRVMSAVALTRGIPGSGGRLPRREVLRDFLTKYAVKGALPAGLHDSVRRARGIERYAPGWLRPETARAFAATDDAAGWKRNPGPRWWAYLCDVTLQGRGTTLLYDHSRHRASMCGIAPRHPIMDPDVVELVLSLPPELAYDHRFSRPLLRQALGAALPDSVRLRPGKSYFDAVFHAAVAGHDLPAIRTLLEGPGAELGRYVDVGAVCARLFDRPRRGRGLQDWAIQVWRLASLEAWLRQERDPDWTERFRAEADLRAARCEVLAPSSALGT